MNSNNDNESKNNTENNFENKLNSLSSSFQSGFKSFTGSDSTSGTSNLSDSNDNVNSTKIMGMDWKILLLVIFIFGLLGINVFVYLAVGTQDIINAIKPITTAIRNFFQNIFQGSILNIFRNAIRGVHDLLFIAQGTIKGGVSAADTLTIQQTNGNSFNTTPNTPNTPNTPKPPSPSTQSYTQPTSLPQSVASNGSINNNVPFQPGQPQPQSLKNIQAQNVANTIPLANTLNNNALNNALNTALVEDTTGNMNYSNSGSTPTPTPKPMPTPTSMLNNNPNSNFNIKTFNYTSDDSMSNIQQSKSTSKSGWCFIGEDRGFRSCIQVNENEKCMSGDIFPSQDICINPNLRQ